MKILTFWKEVQLMPGVKCMLVPVRTVKQDEAFFNYILEAVKKSDLDYTLIVQTEEVEDYRHKGVD